MRIIGAWMLMAVLAAGLWADEVVLTSGGKVEGIAVREEGRVVVEIDSGTVTFDEEDVAAIRFGTTPLHIYQERLPEVEEEGSALAHYVFGCWARDEGLIRHGRIQFRKTIELDPDHEGARRELGYLYFKGSWRTREEVYREQGLVKFEGKWMTPAEVAVIVGRRAEKEAARRRRAEEIRRQREEREEEAARRREEARQRLRDLKEERPLRRRSCWSPYERYYYNHVPTLWMHPGWSPPCNYWINRWVQVPVGGRVRW